MFGKNDDFSFLRDIGSQAFVYEKEHHEKLYQRAWEGVLLLVGYNNDSPTYRIHDSTKDKIVSSLNVTFVECVESNTSSTALTILIRELKF